MAMTNYSSKLVATGAIEGWSNKYVKLYVAYKSVQDIANNRSTVYVGMYVVPDLKIGRWGDYSGSYVGKTTLTFDGTVPAETTSTYWLVENKSFTVNHSADGKGSTKIYWKWGVNSTWGGMVNPSGSFTYTLPTIPRASNVSATNCYIGDNTTITISRASSTFKHTLQYKIDGQSSYTNIVSKTTSTSYKYDTSGFAKDALNLLAPTAKTIGCTIRCITYDSAGNTVGSATTDTITLTGKSSSLAPNIFPIIEDTNTTTAGYTGNINKIIKYYSKPQCYFFTETFYNSDIKSFKVENGSKTLSKDGGIFSSGVESNVFKFTVVDSRGFTVSKTITLAKGTEFIEAVKPTITMTTTSPELITSDSSTTFKFGVNLKGSCFCGNMGAKIAETRVYYRYREVGGSWIGSTVSSGWICAADSVKPEYDSNFNNTKISFDVSTEITGLDYLKAYEIQGRVYNTLEPKETGLQTKKATPIFEWSENDFSFNVPIHLPGNKFYTDEAGGGAAINAHNSDISHLNSLAFSDASGSQNYEGICFYRDGANWDILRARAGNVFFMPNYPANTTEYKMCITPGDVITIKDNTALAGYVSNARKSLLITIPLNKPIVGCDTVSFSGKVEMRGITGYLYSPTTQAASISLTSSAEKLTVNGYLSGTCARLTITFEDTIRTSAGGTTTITNNTPVIIVPDGDLNLTFA